MPTADDLERRLWRVMPWDAAVMEPSPEQDAQDEMEENKKDGGQDDHVPGL